MMALIDNQQQPTPNLLASHAQPLTSIKKVNGTIPGPAHSSELELDALITAFSSQAGQMLPPKLTRPHLGKPVRGTIGRAFYP